MSVGRRRRDDMLALLYSNQPSRVREEPSFVFFVVDVDVFKRLTRVWYVSMRTDVCVQSVCIQTPYPGGVSESVCVCMRLRSGGNVLMISTYDVAFG